MDRREAIAVVFTALAVPCVALAQATRRVYRIAFLDEATEEARTKDYKAFRERLRNLGLVEGSNVAYEVRTSEANPERLPLLAAELVAKKPDIIVCFGTPSARAALRATASIPIVFTGAGDPVGTGLVRSLARPGGNATGFSISSPDVALKSLELLRELYPGVQRVAYLGDPSNPAVITAFSRLEASSRALKLSIQLLDGMGQAALDRSLEIVRRERVQGFVVGGSSGLLDYRDKIIHFAAREKIPVIYTRPEFVESGGLASYGIDRVMLHVRAAELVHRIIKGAKPADIPVEQIAVIRTVINLKAARALGLKIPESVRARMDEVIE